MKPSYVEGQGFFLFRVEEMMVSGGANKCSSSVCSQLSKSWEECVVTSDLSGNSPCCRTQISTCKVYKTSLKCLLGMHLCAWCPGRPVEGIVPPGIEVTDSWKPLCGCWN